MLAKYRENYLCFNDDIQGTGATVLAGVLGALRLQRRPPEDIRSLRVAVVGAGSAGIGVAQALHMAMQQAGLSAKAAYSNFYILDQDGLQSKARFSSLTEEQMAFARADLPDGMALEEVVEQAKPHLVLICPRHVRDMSATCRPRYLGKGPGRACGKCPRALRRASPALGAVVAVADRLVPRAALRIAQSLRVANAHSSSFISGSPLARAISCNLV